MQLAAQVVQYLNSTLTSAGSANQFGIQFGAYASFQALFGLMNMTVTSSALNQTTADDFWGIPDYASTMIWELYSNSTGASGNGTVVSSAYTNTADLFVRFLFHNGTTYSYDEPNAFPMFGYSSVSMPWNTFLTNMNAISIGTTAAWCNICGASSSTICTTSTATTSSNSTTTSSGSSSTSTTAAASSTSTSSSKSHISNAVAGVIGAMVTLAVILGLEAIFLLVGGYKLISKRRLNTAEAVPVTTKA